MGGEQIVHADPRQRVDDKERCRRRVPLGGDVLDLAGCGVDLAECRDEPKRIAGQLSATAVGGVLAGSADRHLYQHRSQGARKIANKAASPPPRLPLPRRPPPKNMPNCASIEIAPAIVA